MQKMKFELADKIINDNTLTKNEIHFLILLASLQNEDGCVNGVYYSNMAKKLSVSESGFYYLRDNLEKKGYIEWTKSFYADIDIRLLDNSFVVDGETVYEEYIDLNVAVFQNEKLYTCRGGAIRCLLYFYKRISSQKAVTMANNKNLNITYSTADAEHARKLWFLPVNFYNTLKKVLGVQIRAVKEYLKELKEWIQIGEVQKEGKLYSVATVLKTAVVKENAYPEQQAHIHSVETYCRRKGIDENGEHLKETAGLLRQYRKTQKQGKFKLLTLLLNAIDRTCKETLNSYNVHAALKNMIELHEPGLLSSLYGI